ncbi:Allantoate amidohydrolase [Frankia canadensis]|uniref:Allantoate amidohydrolase n=1 Tax=Frankia canadensis TaxID=1836972 RepID=A0A2I2KJG5_9ACTN|nr:allantoate amidohydrolase [Frankia canadensis]SNQ45808.1 Allantoate amidohydrolase [Frankia canadensis]SOU53098.1 Allantoate amidohydrolase [Frankia canadensis]
MTFDRLWGDLEQVGRAPETGGYRRYAWTATDFTLREWFAGEAAARGLDLTVDRAGNQWAWWGDPDAAIAAGRPGVAIGSHLDSVPDGGAFDGPLGVVSALLAVDALRAKGVTPSVPIGVVNFGDEEGTRFGVACAGSRMLTGALPAARALLLRDGDGTSMAEAMARAGQDTAHVGRDQETLGRVGCFVELHVEQGRRLVEDGRPVAVGTGIWPHGRWRMEFAGQANHAGTTRLADRRDPMLDYARAVLRARALAERHGVVATCGKVVVEPNGVNAIASRVLGWLDARGADADAVHALVAELSDGVAVRAESWTAATAFDTALGDRLAAVLDDAPRLASGAGHDAGILAEAGVPTAMLFVRNPTGVSHSPAEFAEHDDCLAGVDALTAVVSDLTAVSGLAA